MRGGFLGGCCAPSAAKTKGNAASGRISTRLLPPLSILLEPAPCNIQGKTRLQRVMERVLGDVLEMGCFLQRFLILESELGIAANFSRDLALGVHRFLI